MATVNYLVKGKDNPATIYLRFKHGYNQFDFTKSTNKLIDPKDWSKTKKLPKAKDRLKNLSKDLRGLANHVIDSFNDASPSKIDSDWLKEEIKKFNNRNEPTNEESSLLTDSIQEIIDSANLRPNATGGLGLSSSRVNSYKNLLMMINQFQGDDKIEISQVDLKFGNSFLEWMLNTKHYSEGHAKKKIDDLKTVCRNAELNGLEVNRSYSRLKGGKQKNESIIFLNTHELEQIKKLKLSNKKLDNVRKWLLLGCCLGQRGQDLLNITEDNFITKNGLELIELKQQKTGKRVAIPVLDTTKEILSEGLPYKISMPKFNEYLKVVCKNAGIDDIVYGGKITLVNDKGEEILKNEKGEYLEKGDIRKIYGDFPKWQLISSHICRRSFATNLYGILQTPLIMQITAHGTEKMFLEYIGKTSYDYAQQIADFYKNKN